MTNAIRAAVGALILILVGCNPAEDNSFANPNWAESVNRSATLPLTVGPILTVGLADGMTVPSPDDPRIAWLTEQTGATFEFLSIAAGSTCRSDCTPQNSPTGSFARTTTPSSSTVRS